MRRVRVRCLRHLALFFLGCQGFFLAAPVSAHPGMSTIRTLSDPGSGQWEAQVRAMLLDGYDTNESGWLDRRREVEALPCSVWRDLDAVTRMAHDIGMAERYGIQPREPSSAHRLGFASRVRSAMRGSVRRCMAANPLAMSSSNVEIAAVIGVLPDGGSDSWDAAARALLLMVHDLDHSGAIDQPAELERVSCDEWSALDSGVREGWGHSLFQTYGFAAHRKPWLGYVLGLAETVASEAVVALERCDLVDKSDGAEANEERIVTALRDLPKLGSGEWDDDRMAELLSELLQDSRALETGDVFDEARCTVWKTLDHEGRRDVLAASRELGIDTEVLLYLGIVIERCELPVDVLIDDSMSRIGALAENDTEEWETSVRAILSESFDSDGSGWIDTTEELELISCGVWKLLDGGARHRNATGGNPADGGESEAAWVAGSLGLDVSLRDEVAARVSDCLSPSDVGSAVRRLPNGGSDQWDQQVRNILLEAYDFDQSGQLDAVAELEPVPCDVWNSVDTGVRLGWDSGLYTIYGFGAQHPWVGRVLGFGDDVRDHAALMLDDCGLAGEGLTGVDVVRAVKMLPNGGQSFWDAEVAGLLTVVYDSDHSGIVDRRVEVDAVPCSVWRAIDEGVRDGWGRGLFTVYGADGVNAWLGDTMGIDRSQRGRVARALRVCDLVD